MYISYAIIRHEMYKNNLNILTNMYKHNSRLKERYSNKNIDIDKSKDNYYLKRANVSYYQSIKSVIESKDIESHIQKKSNVLGEFLITSDNNFFNKMNLQEQKQFFNNAYEFVCNKIGEENILNATVHFDEDTPHMHIDYIPMINIGGKKKLSSRAIWKGKDTYHKLQEEYFNYIVKEKGYELERGEVGSLTKHLSVSELKIVTNYDKLLKTEREITKKYWNRELKSSKDIISKKSELSENKGVLKKGTYEITEVKTLVNKYEQEINELSKQSDKKDNIINDLTSDIKGISMNLIFEKSERLEKDNERLRLENNRLRRTLDVLLKALENIKKILVDIPFVKEIISGINIFNKSKVNIKEEILKDYIEVDNKIVDDVDKINRKFKSNVTNKTKNRMSNELEM